MAKLTKIHTKRVFFTHAQIHNGRIDFHQILPIHSLGEHSDIFELPSKLVKGFCDGGLQNLAFSIDFGIDF